MAKVLVTGGAGFIGKHLCHRLISLGHDVVVFDDLSTGRHQNIEDGCEFIHSSITSIDELLEAVSNADIVYHLAAAVGVQLVSSDPLHTIRTNVGPTEHLLQQAAAMQTKVFLASTSEVYGAGRTSGAFTETDDIRLGPPHIPRWAYACSKAMDEYLAIAHHCHSGLPVVVGRFFNVVGPGQLSDYGMVIPSMVRQAQSTGVISVHGDGRQVRCFSHVSEVVSAMLALMDNESAHGQIVNIGSSSPVSINELATTVAELVGPEVQIKYVSYESVFGKKFEDVRCRIPDVTLLEKLTGRTPTMSIREIIQDVLTIGVPC